jgi:Ca2+-binding RTX toxin-like protein
MFKTIRSWLRSPSANPATRQTRLRLESLDVRIVPAVGVTRNVFGQVVIQGGASNDVADVTLDDRNVIVTLNGQTTTFDRNKVRGIVFRGEAGDDSFVNNTSIASRAFGGSGNDSLTGGSGNDDLQGQAGDDRLAGGAGNDNLNGGDGDDSLQGGDGNDVEHGGRGDDSLSGANGNDRLFGDDGADHELGDAGDDSIFGGGGNDRIDGGAGRDWIAGGFGANTSLSDANDSHDDCGRHDGHRRADGLAQAEGTITAIDATAGTLTILTEKGATVTLTVDANTKFEINEAPATLADFHVGDAVEAKFNPDTNVATKIESAVNDAGENEGNDDRGGHHGGRQNGQRAQVEGSITAIDAAAGRVTIKTRAGRSVTVSITPQTRLERNDVHVTLDAFQVGDAAEARFDPATGVATKLEAVGA